MTFEKIFTDLKAKKFAPVYFLEGDEPYYIEAIADFIEENALDESEKSFNQTILYGKETEVETILENAKRFPMMSEKQVVVVKEAQNIKNIESLHHYFASPLASTILVICYKDKTIDKRKKEGKALAQEAQKNGVLFTSKKLYDNQLPDWITQRVKEAGMTINLKTATVLAEFLGNDLSRIVNEIEKLALLIEKGKEIDLDTVEKNIGVSKEFNNFELVSALVKKDVYKVFQIAAYFSKNPSKHPLVLTLGILYGLFSKLILYHYLQNKSKENVASVLKVNPYFTSDYQVGASNYSIKKSVEAIAILREYDKKSKGIHSPPIEQGELLKEMLYKLLN